MNNAEYEQRVRELESEGMTRSDAQAVADAEEMQGFDSSDPFADISEDEFEAELARPDKPSKNQYTEDIGDIELYREKCPKCGGTGRYRGPSRYGADCFKCKGKGELVFKTAPEARAKARKYAQKRNQRSQAENVEAFKAEFPEEAKWLISHSDGNTFADSLIEGVQKYGRLTEKQLAAVRNGMARDADAAAGFEKWAEDNAEIAAWLIDEESNGNEFAGSLIAAVKRYGSLTERQEAAVLRNLDKAPKAEAASDLDISSLKGYYAVPGGETRLKVCVRKPGKNSRWHGWTFVDDGAEYGNRKTYGRQAPDGLYKGEIQEQLKAILDDPLAAQKAYGHLTGVCGRCGRILEDEESVAAGIGPICATKV